MNRAGTCRFGVSSRCVGLRLVIWLLPSSKGMFLRLGYVVSVNVFVCLWCTLPPCPMTASRGYFKNGEKKKRLPGVKINEANNKLVKKASKRKIRLNKLLNSRTSVLCAIGENRSKAGVCIAVTDTPGQRPRCPCRLSAQ